MVVVIVVVVVVVVVVVGVVRTGVGNTWLIKKKEPQTRTTKDHQGPQGPLRTT